MNSLGRSRTDSRKQAVSVRLSRSDVRQIKQLALRLGAHESDVIRFAIKLMLEQLSPLQDPKVSGRSLVPVFMGLGAELMRHFELDAGSLTGIINDGADEARRVEPDDIHLLAMTGSQRLYTHLGAPVRQARIPGGTESARPSANSADAGSTESDTLETTLRRYLYEKYLHSGPSASPNGTGSPV